MAHARYNSVDPRLQLRAEHEALEDRFRDLHVRARGGDWSDLNDVWSDFCADFERHMRFEEDALFGAYVEAHPDRAEEIAAFRAEHEEIRRLLEVLAVEIQVHEIRAETVDRFLQRIRRHAAAEARCFYPWAEGLAVRRTSAA